MASNDVAGNICQTLPEKETESAFALAQLVNELGIGALRGNERVEAPALRD